MIINRDDDNDNNNNDNNNNNLLLVFIRRLVQINRIKSKYSCGHKP